KPRGANASRADSLGKEMMHAAGLESENLAAHVESRNLPAAIGKQTIDADAAKPDLVQVLCLLALCIYLRARRIERDRLRRTRKQHFRRVRYDLCTMRCRRKFLGGVNSHDPLPMNAVGRSIAQIAIAKNSVWSVRETT